MNSSAHKSPLVTEFVAKILLTLEEKEYISDKKEVINADIVPKGHEKLTPKKGMKASIHTPGEEKQGHKRIKRSYLTSKKKHGTTKKIIFEKKDELIKPSPSLKKASLDELYGGKIRGLINDPSVASIECLGPNIPINIFRHGQKMRTKISLSEVEIEKILTEISKEAMIPISDGVFRVIVNNLMVNAVISEVVGTKFLIKKLFPLEHGRH